jgi:predicted short-subunit dehydrogenase-like oxidoreductase (DUF2520 family)
MKISFLGSGNVTHVLARMVHRTAHSIQQIICRRPGEVQQLASALAIPSVISFDEPVAIADIYIIALSDSALGSLHNIFSVNQGIVVHTAGAVGVDVLEKIGPETGVLYPFQSLRKELQQVPKIPFLVHSAHKETLHTLYSFAQDLSPLVEMCTDEERKKYHLSAVMSANFINHLLTLSFDYCKSEHINPGLLEPILKETIDRVKNIHPSLLQTGPAIRNDSATITMHEGLLASHPEMLGVYQLLTKSIHNYYRLRNIE